MVREIMHDEKFLSVPSTDCTEEDKFLYDDLMDTLKEYSNRCVGMAANMIGFQKNAIIFREEDGSYTVMFNPQIVSTSEESYTTEEGCLSLEGQRKTRRYKSIEVMFLNKNFRQKIRTLEGFTAQIVQHEIDHTQGRLI
ncbi:MAG: peptide deformylase [Sphaerochaetaceae bacterium]|nr:peptide deformylase [Sphaerochaetaceae bacterium]